MLDTGRGEKSRGIVEVGGRMHLCLLFAYLLPSCPLPSFHPHCQSPLHPFLPFSSSCPHCSNFPFIISPGFLTSFTYLPALSCFTPSLSPPSFLSVFHQLSTFSSLYSYHCLQVSPFPPFPPHAPLFLPFLNPFPSPLFSNTIFTRSNSPALYPFSSFIYHC